MKAKTLVGRKSLAPLLRLSESSTRNWQRRGLISPAVIVDGRPLFDADEAVALRARIDAEKAQGAAA